MVKILISACNLHHMFIENYLNACKAGPFNYAGILCVKHITIRLILISLTGLILLTSDSDKNI
jgi:hypothetical protein